MNCAVFDDYYIETMGMTLTDGRSFSKDFNDTLSIILNEAALSALGIEGDPLGQRVTLTGGGNNPNGNVDHQIVGVIRNYNYRSLHTEITSMAIFSNEGQFGGTGFFQ